MALVYAYSLDGDADTGAFDYPLDTTNTPSRNMAVKLVAGKLQKSVPADTTILGVMTGSNFTGLNLAPTIGKIIVGKLAVFRADFTPGTKTTFTNSDIGSTFDLATGALNINPDAIAVGQFRIVGFNNALKVVYVINNKPVFI